MHSNNQQYLFTMRLFGLFIKCPFREATLDCPFSDIRSLQSLDLKFLLAERFAMHPQRYKTLHVTHEACFRTRLQQVVNTGRGISVTTMSPWIKPPSYNQAAVVRR
jgi:hypothetical protein